VRQGNVELALRSGELSNAVVHRFDFWNSSYEWRRIFSEVFGTFLLVTVAAGGGIVNAKFGGHVVPPPVRVTGPGLMVLAIILFMGGVSGAHLNPVVSIAFALRGDFPWQRVPGYLIAQFVGAILATLVLLALLGKHGSAGETLPGPGISTTIALAWEALLTIGLVSVVLGTASGSQNLGPIAAIAVGSYIILAGLFGAPVSGASMNPARSLGPALVIGDWTSWWAYLVGPLIGALIAVGFAHILRGPGGGQASIRAAQGTLGTLWWPETLAGLKHAAPGPGPGNAQDVRNGSPDTSGGPSGQGGGPSGQGGGPSGQGGGPSGPGGGPSDPGGESPGGAQT
jgi:aquaporin Z